MLCLGENEIKGRKKVYLLLRHLLSKSFPNNLSGTGFVFVLALNKKNSALLKIDSAKTALLGKIYSLKPVCTSNLNISLIHIRGNQLMKQLIGQGILYFKLSVKSLIKVIQDCIRFMPTIMESYKKVTLKKGQYIHLNKRRYLGPQSVVKFDQDVLYSFALFLFSVN